MYELIQVGKNSFYMDCPAKVGFYRTGENEVVLIDSGSDKDAAKKVKRILDENGWTLKTIFNTHFHADHIGGNNYLQTQYACDIYAPPVEVAVVNHPLLEPTLLVGGYAMKDLRNKFLMAKESVAKELTEDALPAGMEIINLNGHSETMVGYRTDDNVIFLADCVLSEETLNRYQIGYLYDVKEYIATLEMVKTLDAECFVPSHAPHTSDIVPLADKNLNKTFEIISIIEDILKTPMTHEDLLAEIFARFDLHMNLQQRMLIGSTLNSYLAYLKDEGLIDYRFEDNHMLWEAKVNIL